MITDPHYRERLLDNGLRVGMYHSPTGTVSASLRILHATMHETPDESGLAHFLEHALVAGGSAGYTPAQSDMARAQFGSFRATTSLEETVFSADMLPEDLPSFLTYVADTVFRPGFDTTLIDQERQRVLREIADQKSSPAYDVSQRFAAAFFGPHSPHTRSVLGDEAVVASAGTDALARFHARGYHPNNMDLVLAGNLPQHTDRVIDSVFGSVKAGVVPRLLCPPNTPPTGQTVIHVPAPDLYHAQNPALSSSELSLGFYAPTETHPDSAAVEALSFLLGGGATARLFKSVSQRAGIAYGIGATYTATPARGSMAVTASLHAQRQEEALGLIFDEFAVLREQLAPAAVVDQLKHIARYRVAQVLDSNQGRLYAARLSWDAGIGPQQHLKNLAAVTPERIREVAQHYLPARGGAYVLALRDPLLR